MERPEGIGTPLLRGVITIIATVFAMSLADALVKSSSADMTLWQIWVLRSLFIVPILMVLARKSIPPAGLGWVVLRSLILAAMYLGIYAGIPLLDLSVVAAALYTGPLFIVCLSAAVLRERVTGPQWVAILTGFAGVLFIVRPTAPSFSQLTLLPVAAAFLYALAAVLTRAKCSTVPATTMALWLNMALLALGGVASVSIPHLSTGLQYPFLFGDWQPMDAGDWWLIVALAILMIAVSIGFAMAYQSPRPQVIATFDYAYLIFAGFWGFLFFGETPDIWTIAGMLLIAAAGLTVLSAQRRDAPKAASAS
jgi:drug/metabolite transporter (DMT)-like permease